MATYKAVMRPALEYASSIWSPLASSTSINKLHVMQNTTLRTATRCTQDTNIQLPNCRVKSTSRGHGLCDLGHMVGSILVYEQ